MRMRAFVFVALAYAASACGGGGTPTGPSGPQLTRLTFTDGLSGSMVSGGTVQYNGQTIPIQGGVAEIPDLAANGEISINASGYALRQTRYRNGAMLDLWVDQQGRLTSDVSRNVGFKEDGRLKRLEGPALIVPSAEVEADAAAMANLRTSAAMITALTGNQIQFTVGSSGPGARFNFVLVPELGAGAEVASTTDASGRITGGEIRFRSLIGARSQGVVLHEFGHVLGLGHNSGEGLMHITASVRFSDFTPEEKAVITMILKRRPGTRFPDDDR